MTHMIQMEWHVHSFKNKPLQHKRQLRIWISTQKQNCFSLGSSSQNLTIASHRNPRKLELHV